MVIIFDASGSMAMSMDATPEEIMRWMQDKPVPVSIVNLAALRSRINPLNTLSMTCQMTWTLALLPQLTATR